MSFLINALFGRKPKVTKQNVLNQAQEQLLDQLIQEILGGAQFSEEQFQRDFTDPAMKEFNERIAPSIQQRLIAGGQGRSSSIENLLARAGSNVEADLAKIRGGLLDSSANRRANLASTALGTRPFGIIQDPGSQGIFSEIFSGVLGGLGTTGAQAAGSRFGFR